MSVSHSARCLFSTPILTPIRHRVPCRNFHISPKLNTRSRRKIKSIKAEDMGLIDKSMPAKEIFKTYDSDERAALTKIYTRKQLAAIEAGEEAIDPKDLKTQGFIRTDMGRLQYFDDLSIIRSMMDRKRLWDGPVDPREGMQGLDEHGEAWAKAHDELEAKRKPVKRTEDATKTPEEIETQYNKERFPSRLDLMKIEDTMTIGMGTGVHLPRDKVRDYTAPGVPRSFLPKEGISKKNDEDDNDPRDPDGIYNRLIAQTGLTLDEILDYKIKILVQHKVSNQTRLGKIAGQYCLAIAGNGNGLLGIGQAKGQDAGQTSNLAKISAIRNMQPIPRYEDRTIFGEVEAKVSAVRVKLMSRPPGFGLRCQHLIFEMARAAGFQDLAARVPRSRNKMNTCKAVYKALLNQPAPEKIAWGRGKKLVDVRKVYYGGQV